MRLKKIVKAFIFENKNRSRITLGDKVRLDPNNHRLELELASGGYSTDADLYAKTWITNPNRIKQWVGFDVEVEHDKDYAGDPYSSLGFRLGNGTDQYWWNGASWAVDTTHWNTEEEIAINISSFSVTSKEIQVILNLVTTNAAYTPSVKEVKILYNSDIDFQDDIVFQSLLPALRSGVRPISDYLVKIPSSSSTIDLTDDFPLSTPYNIVGIDSVFNHTDDSDHFTDIFQSYNTGTKVITLSEAIDDNEEAWIRFIYEPEVAVSTDEEYIEVAKVPAIHITSIDVETVGKIMDSPSVRKNSNNTVVVLRGGRLRDIKIVLICVSGSSKDQQRLADEVENFFSNNSYLNSVGLDEDFDIIVSSPYTALTRQSEQLTYSGNFRFTIKNTLSLQKQESNLYTVAQLELGGNIDVTIS